METAAQVLLNELKSIRDNLASNRARAGYVLSWASSIEDSDPELHTSLMDLYEMIGHRIDGGEQAESAICKAIEVLDNYQK